MKSTISIALITLGLGLAGCGLPAKDKEQYENKISWAEADYKIKMESVERFHQLTRSNLDQGFLSVARQSQEIAKTTLDKADRVKRYAECLNQWREKNRPFIDAQAACSKQEGIDLP